MQMIPVSLPSAKAYRLIFAPGSSDSGRGTFDVLVTDKTNLRGDRLCRVTCTGCNTVGHECDDDVSARAEVHMLTCPARACAACLGTNPGTMRCLPECQSRREDTAAIYPCSRCGVMRTKDQGGTVFTVCDECWTVLHPDQRSVAQGEA